MTRRRFVWSKEENCLVEITADWTPTPRTELMTGGCYEGARATDGTPVDTRQRHREYMRQHNLTTVDDYKETWQRDAKEREALRSGQHEKRERREAVERAIYQRSKP